MTISMTEAAIGQTVTPEVESYGTKPKIDKIVEKFCRDVNELNGNTAVLQVVLEMAEFYEGEGHHQAVYTYDKYTGKLHRMMWGKRLDAVVEGPVKKLGDLRD